LANFGKPDGELKKDVYRIFQNDIPFHRIFRQIVIPDLIRHPGGNCKGFRIPALLEGSIVNEFRREIFLKNIISFFLIDISMFVKGNCDLFFVKKKREYFIPVAIIPSFGIYGNGV
jgi:hypothetical protein